MRFEIVLRAVLATSLLAACDSSATADSGAKKAAAPEAPASAASSPAKAEPKESEADKKAKEEAAKAAELDGLIVDLVGEDSAKKEVAYKALKERGEEIAPRLGLALIDQCKLAMQSEDKTWGAHNVMKQSMYLLTLLESSMGKPGVEALQTTLGEREFQGGWGASFTTACKSS